MEAKVPDSKKPDWSYLDIYLFSNGQENSPPRKYHLVAEDMDCWEKTLNYLAKAQFGPIYSSLVLYTTDGRLINTPLELRQSTAYVAVLPKEDFQHAGYDKYLIKATRSWERRQDKRTSNAENQPGEREIKDKYDQKTASMKPLSSNAMQKITPSTIDQSSIPVKTLPEKSLNQELNVTNKNHIYYSTVTTKSPLQRKKFVPKELTEEAIDRKKHVFDYRRKQSPKMKVLRPCQRIGENTVVEKDINNSRDIQRYSTSKPANSNVKSEYKKTKTLPKQTENKISISNQSKSENDRLINPKPQTIKPNDTEKKLQSKLNLNETKPGKIITKPVEFEIDNRIRQTPIMHLNKKRQKMQPTSDDAKEQEHKKNVIPLVNEIVTIPVIDRNVQKTKIKTIPNMVQTHDTTYPETMQVSSTNHSNVQLIEKVQNAIPKEIKEGEKLELDSTVDHVYIDHSIKNTESKTTQKVIKSYENENYVWEMFDKLDNNKNSDDQAFILCTNIVDQVNKKQYLSPPLLSTESKECYVDSYDSHTIAKNRNSICQTNELSPPSFYTQSETTEIYFSKAVVTTKSGIDDTDFGKRTINVKIEILSSNQNNNLKQNSSQISEKLPVIILNENRSQGNITVSAQQDKHTAGEVNGLEMNHEVLLLKGPYTTPDEKNTVNRGRYIVYIPVLKLNQPNSSSRDASTDMTTLGKLSSIYHPVKIFSSYTSIHKAKGLLSPDNNVSASVTISVETNLNEEKEKCELSSSKRRSVSIKESDLNSLYIKKTRDNFIRPDEGTTILEDQHSIITLSQHLPSDATSDIKVTVLKDQSVDKNNSQIKPQGSTLVSEVTIFRDPDLSGMNTQSRTRESVNEAEVKFLDPQPLSINRQHKIENLVNDPLSPAPIIRIEYERKDVPNLKSSDLNEPRLSIKNNIAEYSKDTTTPETMKSKEQHKHYDTSESQESKKISTGIIADHITVEIISKNEGNARKSLTNLKEDRDPEQATTPLFSIGTRTESIAISGEANYGNTETNLSANSEALAENRKNSEMRRANLTNQTRDASVQTEWADVLWEAKLEADGHYTFHLPSLAKLKDYKLC